MELDQNRRPNELGEDYKPHMKRLAKQQFVVDVGLMILALIVFLSIRHYFGETIHQFFKQLFQSLKKLF